MADQQVEKTKPVTDAAATAASTAGANGSDTQQPRLHWDDSDMSTSYANVVNVSVTREEVGLFFGTNLTTGVAGTSEVTIRLSDRVIMTPHAAKRFAMLLNANIKAFEERFGALDVGAGETGKS